jgi:hypothetical protein
MGLNHGQVGVFCCTRRELLDRAHNDADVDATTQKLLQDAKASTPSATNKQNGLLIWIDYIL